MGTGRARRLAALLSAAVALAVVASGCGSLYEQTTESTEQDRGVMGGVAPSAPSGDGIAEEYAQEAPAAAPDTTDRMIIRTQTMRLQVDSTTDAVESLRGLVAEHAAVITDLQVATDSDEWLYRYDEYGYSTGDGSALRGWVTVRVPAENLDAFVTAAMQLGDVKYQSEGSQDVTQEHVDLTARLENLRAEEQRLRTFFDAATDVEDMLAIETELNRVRQEIEALDAQVTYLERQAAMATVTIELTEDKPVVRPEGDSWGFDDAITAGFQGAANVIKFVLAFLIATAPLWLLAVVAFFVVRAVLRKRRAQRAGVEQ